MFPLPLCSFEVVISGLSFCSQSGDIIATTSENCLPNTHVFRIASMSQKISNDTLSWDYFKKVTMGPNASMAFYFLGRTACVHFLLLDLWPYWPKLVPVAHLFMVCTLVPWSKIRHWTYFKVLIGLRSLPSRSVLPLYNLINTVLLPRDYLFTFSLVKRSANFSPNWRSSWSKLGKSSGGFPPVSNIFRCGGFSSFAQNIPGTHFTEENRFPRASALVI